jgi:hypothetical protein
MDAKDKKALSEPPKLTMTPDRFNQASSTFKGTLADAEWAQMLTGKLTPSIGKQFSMAAWHTRVEQACDVVLPVDNPDRYTCSFVTREKTGIFPQVDYVCHDRCFDVAFVATKKVFDKNS